jgi:chemotaxis protein MotB
VLANNPVWDDSTKAANAVRKLFEATELVDEARILRVTGHASLEPKQSDTMSVRNNRIEVIMLR